MARVGVLVLEPDSAYRLRFDQSKNTMEAFAIIGFIFGLSASGIAGSNTAKIKKLENKLKELESKFHELKTPKEPEK